MLLFLYINIANLFFWLFAVNGSIDGLVGTGRISFWLSVPADLGALIRRPWTLFTYMFVQESFFHLLFNMIVLYFGGRIFIEYLDDKKLINTYIWGGLFGALFYILAFNVFPVFNDSLPYSIALGASASVLAVLVAVATYKPNYTMYLFLIGKTKLKYIAIALVVIDILSINRGNPGGHIAHLGGALWGYLSILLLQRGILYPLGIRWHKIKNIFNWFKKRPKSSFSQVHVNKRPETDDQYNRRKVEKQKVIDQILDKIAKSGYDSLTKEEKQILFDASDKK